MFRADAHVHLDRIGPPHRTDPVSPEEFANYVRWEHLKLIFGIYEDEVTLEAFRRATPAEIAGFYWLRRPKVGSVPDSASGLKLHPYIDDYPLTEEQVGGALKLASERALPILIHMDDRNPAIARPRLVRRLARMEPSVKLIMAHGGSYAPPNWDAIGTSSVPRERVRELVEEAVDVANSCRNVWLETSTLASIEKARVIVEQVAPEKVLIGSDYPILRGSYGSIRRQEDVLAAVGWSASVIADVHENAKMVLGEA